MGMGQNILLSYLEESASKKQLFQGTEVPRVLSRSQMILTLIMLVCNWFAKLYGRIHLESALWRSKKYITMTKIHLDSQRRQWNITHWYTIYIYTYCVYCVYIYAIVFTTYLYVPWGFPSPFFGTEIYTCPMAPAGSGPIQGSTASPNPVDLWLWRCHLHIELHPLVIKTHFLQWKMTWTMDENGPFSLMIIYDNGKYGC